MLFLSQADRGSSARRVATASLVALARQVAEYHDAVLGNAGLQVEVIGDAAGDFDLPLLQRALSNCVFRSNVTGHFGDRDRSRISNPRDRPLTDM